MNIRGLRSGRDYSIALILAVIAALLTASAAASAPGKIETTYGAGSLDPSFGMNGVAITDLGSTSATPVDVAFRSVGQHDGWLLESTETSNLGGSLNRLATTFNIGDNQKDRQYRALLSFNTGALPDSAIVMAAHLDIKREDVVGSDPFGTFGRLLLTVRRGTFSNNLGLQLSDFSAPGSPGATKDQFQHLAFDVYRATLSNGNLVFINRIGPTQFRLAFAKDDNDNLSSDYLKFFSGNSDFLERPELVITYWVP